MLKGVFEVCVCVVDVSYCMYDIGDIVCMCVVYCCCVCVCVDLVKEMNDCIVLIIKIVLFETRLVCCLFVYLWCDGWLLVYVFSFIVELKFDFVFGGFYRIGIVNDVAFDFDG